MERTENPLNEFDDNTEIRLDATAVKLFYWGV